MSLRPSRQRHPVSSSAASPSPSFVLSFLCLLLLSLVGGVQGAWQQIADFSDCGSTNFQTQEILVNFDDTSYWLDVSILGNFTTQVVDSNSTTNRESKLLIRWQLLILATLISSVTYLQNQIYYNRSAFCDFIQPSSSTLNSSCPLQPGLHAFGIHMQLLNNYQFGTIVPTIQVLSADVPPINLVCVQFQLTQRISTPIDVTFSIVPLAIVLFVGFATLYAAIYNPWTGTWNLLRATSNFGQDPDALRLVTPGLSEIWYYIQFAVFTACLSLDYPGIYQPIMSRVSWSNLLFNTTLLHPGGNDTLSWSTITRSFSGQFDNATSPSLINIVNGSDYGLTQYANLVGIAAKDVWPTFIAWFLLVLACILVLTQLGFGIYWLYRYITGEHTVDFGAQNVCFLGGMVLRVWSLFYVSLVTFSCYEFVVASSSPKFVVGLSVVALILLGILLPMVLIVVIARYRQRGHLFDDLLLLLLLGPLYNTYHSPKVLFVATPYFIRLIQGIVIGAAQPSGIAQIILLAVLEIVFLCVVNASRPFHPRTSMNAWHTFMSIIRLIVILFLVAFIPSLAVDPGVRGWIGYTILVIHGAVLVLVFLLNVILTIVEISARLAGAGEDSARREREFGLANVFGINQLMRRRNSHRTTSNIDDDEPRTIEESKLSDRRRYSRNSSQGGSSYGLIDVASFPSRGSTPAAVNSGIYERRNTMSPVSATSVGFSNLPRTTGGLISPTPTSFIGDNGRTSSTAYYRQPRRSTFGGLSPISPISGTAAGLPQRYDPTDREAIDTAVRTAFNDSIEDIRRTTDSRPQSRAETKPRPNYAVREADAFYYRRPDYSQPLNPGTSSGRKLGTGPADPTSPVAVASSWIGRLFRGNPEKGKFEVVRGNVARATDIPLAEKKVDSRPSTAGKGDDVESPLVESGRGIQMVEEHPDEDGRKLSEEIPSTSLAMRPESPALSQDLGTKKMLDRPVPPPITIPAPRDSLDSFVLTPPPKNPNRGSMSSFEDIPPSIPRKSSARQSPRIVPETLGTDERMRQVKVHRPVWTRHHEGSRESVGKVEDSANEWSDGE